MKNIFVLFILLCAIALPALGELTDADLDKIRLIVNEGVKKESAASETRELTDADLDKIRLIVNDAEARIKADVKKENAASETRMKEYIDLKLDSVNNQIKTNSSEIGAIRTQINVFIGLPLLIITLLFAWRALRDRANDKQVQALIAENKYLKQQQTITP